MTAFPHAAHYALRTEIRTALRDDLLGPRSGVEEILAADAPITAYPIGVLFPQSGGTAPPFAEEEDGADTPPDVVSRDDSEQGATDLGVALANRRKPSSMGLTFAVDPTIAQAVHASVRAAMYVPEDEHGLPVEPRRGEARSTEQQKERWRRIPVECAPASVDVVSPGVASIELRPGLELRTLVRAADRNGVVTVTATVVNTLRTGEYDLQDAYCFFQPELALAGPEGTRPFVERPAPLGAVDAEQALSRLLHRHAPTFATGHGCSVAWDWQAPALRASMPGRAAVNSVRTEFMPTHDVLLTDSNPEIDDATLGMHGLGHGSAAEVGTALGRLLDGYEEWITARRAEAAGLSGADHTRAAERQIALCEETLIRMRRGVALLGDPGRPGVFEAFRLANRAMAAQRSRGAWIKGGRRGTPDPTEGRWRPFQIAFLLLCLEGIVDPKAPDREVADLLWFPTGGGKTEAYLGLIAFTVFLRRLRDGAEGDGVTVLMRYTLRLLTLQQFERAAALICAMERVRVERGDLGTTPVSIGMWVGASATPNVLARAGKRLEELQRNPRKSLAKENPVQLHSCPWCGEPLGPHDYEVSESDKRMFVRCPGPGCPFAAGAGLPVHLVDEAVYDAHPTLVIATVDKFASMPWRPATSALFNRDVEGDVKPPELIVQDELHLISGPLGTLTGLYETAVDILADRPKVVASTATIRRASDQVKALFDRRVAQFPPAGLDARDSWFAVETAREAKASRRYVGLLTPGTSQATLLIRTYATLLHAAARAEADPTVRDAYWTLVGYFNSLRLLSAAELQVLDDVQDRLELLAARDETKAARSATALEELSSRADSSAIPRRLRQLEHALPGPEVLDVLLATNMISVGVDIDRLGLMAVMGQPQTTAEYIQATSRVGRRHPGLIAVMLNSARSRDRSHYENFPGFHSALYREVESTSVTPFSARARDRGLHAVIVALTRLMIPAAADNRAASAVEGFVDDINRIVRPRVVARAGAVDSDEQEATGRHFDAFVEWWLQEAEDRPNLVYETRHGSGLPAVLAGFDDTDDASGEDAGWSTLWSLRDVDAESVLFQDNNR